MLASLNPAAPVYCVRPAVYAECAQEFTSGFPGRVLYAVKANNDPVVLSALANAGIRHYDCASLAEIELVRSLQPEAKCYFMNPVRLPGAAREAFDTFGTRHFMVDDLGGLAPLLEEIDAAQCVVFARMAVHHESAMEDLSSKFGAVPDEVPALLAAIRETGAEAALAFNVGSGVLNPDAYAHALSVTIRVLEQLPFRIRLLDVGGGFPRSYPGFAVPSLQDYFAVFRRFRNQLPLADDAELLAEPGRALAAPGMSTVVRVLQRKRERLYINDGMYGAFWELRFNGHKQYRARAYRIPAPLTGQSSDFVVFGPTCDSSDRLPEPVPLPADIRAGDFIEFDSTGAYSLSGRTDFNGFYSDTLVTIRR